MSRMPGSMRVAVAAVAALLLSVVGFAQDNTAGATGASPPADKAPNVGAPDAQRAQLHADIAKLHAAARAQIRALLTDEQQAKFDALPILKGPPGCHGMGKAFGHCAGGANAATRGENASHGFLDRLTQKLNLTDAQRASIQPVLEQAWAAKQARREQARSAFRTLLTPEQAAKLDELKAQPGSHTFGRRGGLQLTAEQQVQADAIFQQLRTDLQQMRTDTRQQIRAQLTPEQQTQFDALRPVAGGRAAKHGMHAGRALGDRGARLDRLAAELNLTDPQRASVQTILDDLHTAIRERVQQARLATPASANTEE